MSLATETAIRFFVKSTPLFQVRPYFFECKYTEDPGQGVILADVDKAAHTNDTLGFMVLGSPYLEDCAVALHLRLGFPP